MDDSPSNAALIDLAGRRALVTGGANGIGAAICRRLHQAGAIVTVSDLDPVGEQLADELDSQFVGCDITDPTQLRSAIDSAAGDGELSILVNNAGVYPTTGPLAEVSDDFVSRMLDINVRAQFSATRDAAARMGGGGAIVNLASIAGLGGGAGISAYSASKAAVIALTRAAARELGPRGIRVNAIAPGMIDTPGVRAQMAPLKEAGIDVDARIAANPLRKAGQPDHIAQAALFLSSDLSSFVNGVVLVVDGGSTA